MENMKNLASNEIVQKPVYSPFLTGRALVRYFRAVNAYNLAARVEPKTPVACVSREGYDRAEKLLDRIRRYALASVRQFEKAETSKTYAKSQESVRDVRRLESRLFHLEKELSVYGLYIRFYGLYPTIEDRDGHSCIFLHFYD